MGLNILGRQGCSSRRLLPEESSFLSREERRLRIFGEIG
jgi:hypothetical protein